MTGKIALSQPQRRIWNIEKIHPDTPIHCVGGVTVLTGGEIRPDILRSAFLFCLRNNAIFRLRLSETEDEPWQYFCDETEAPTVHQLDFSEQHNPLEVFYEWAKAVFTTPFDLKEGPLFYVAVVQLKDGQTAFFLKFHHILADGWSVSLFIDQAYDVYRQIARKADVSLPASGEYLRLVAEEENYQRSDEFLKDRTFWIEKFKDLQPNFPQAQGSRLDGKRKQFDCPDQLSELILAYSKKNHAGINLLLIALVLFYEHRRTGCEELVIGIPLLNRNSSVHKKTIGMYTSTMPLRIRFAGNISIRQLLMLVKEELKKCYQHQKYPYNFLVQDLELRKKQAHGLFNLCVNYYATKLPATFEGAQATNDEFYCGCQPYHLQVTVKEWGNSIQFQYDYRTDLFTDFEIDCLNETLVHLAAGFCTCDDRLLDDIEMLSDRRHGEITKKFERTRTGGYSGGHLLDRWSRLLVPDSELFLSDENGRSLTRGDFRANVIKLAAYLRKCGVKDQDRIAILMSHSFECIVSMMAVMAAGAVFVPMDAAIPGERMKYILDDTASAFVLTNLGRADVPDVPILRYKEIPFESLTGEGFVPRVSGKDLAYIMYTSGSTGRPKGVAITHDNLINYCTWAAETYVRPSGEVFAFFTSIGFDLTITSLFVPMISPSKIKIFFPEKAEGPHVLYRVFGSAEVTLVKCTPSHLVLLQDAPVCSGGKRLIIGGEDLKASLAAAVTAQLGENTDLFNEYGPTEATVGCMIHLFNAGDKDERSVPIGGPISNTAIYLLDGKLRHVPVGTPGEIYIGGRSVSPGYWNSPALNEERFVRSPWDPSMILYRTGDIGRIGNKQKMIYEGRADEQVKINGHRVELREIGSVLASHESIRNVYIKASPFLVAYLIVNEGYSPDAIQAYLRARLPGYMIPAHFVTMTHFPLNSNGKVDSQQLPVPSAPADRRDGPRPEFTRDGLLIASVVKQMLELDTVDPDDNFFSIGGDSVTAIRLSSRLRSMGCLITTQAILANPIIGDMAKMVRQPARPDDANGKSEKFYRDFSTATTDWFFDQEFANPEYYHQSVLLEMKVEIDAVRLNEMFRRMISAHDSLKLVVRRERRQVGYSPELSPDDFGIEEYWLDGKTDVPSQLATIGGKIKRSVSFNGDFLFRVALFNGTGGQRWILLVFHHLLVDAVSWEIILGQLRLLIGTASEGQPFTLPHESTLWSDWALCSARVQPRLKGPEARRVDRPVLQDTLEGDLDAGDRARLLRKAAEAVDVSIHELLMIVLLLAWHRVTGQREIVLEVERHGREIGQDVPDISHTIGWFTVFERVRAGIPGGSLPDRVQSLKQQISKESTTFSEGGRPIRFNFLGSFHELDNAYFRISDISTGRDVDPINLSSAEFEFNCWIIKNKLYFRIVCDPVPTRPHLAGSLVEAFGDILSAIAEESDLHAGLSKDDLVSLFE